METSHVLKLAKDLREQMGGSLSLEDFARVLLCSRNLFNLKMLSCTNDLRIGHITINMVRYLDLVRCGLLKAVPLICFRKPANMFLAEFVSRGYMRLFAENENQYAIITTLASALDCRDEVYHDSTPPNPKGAIEWIYTLENLSPAEQQHYWNYKMDSRHYRLNFSPEENRQGSEIMRQMGVEDENWCVLFNVRDGAYLKSTLPNTDWSYHDYRNSDIATLTAATEYVAEMGGKAVQYGSVVGQYLQSTNPGVVDAYVRSFRSEFMDIYLASRAKFVVGGCGGATQYPHLLFGTPIVIHNFCPHFITIAREVMQNTVQAWRDPSIPWKKFAQFFLVLPKRYWSIREKRELTLEEIYSMKLLYRTEDYARAGVELIENTSEEILAATREMNDRVDGRWNETAEEMRLRKNAVELAARHGKVHNMFCHYTTDFLYGCRDQLNW